MLNMCVQYGDAAPRKVTSCGEKPHADARLTLNVGAVCTTT